MIDPTPELFVELFIGIIGVVLVIASIATLSPGLSKPDLTFRSLFSWVLAWVLRPPPSQRQYH